MDPDTEVTPSSYRIIEDVGRLKQNMKLVIEADGAVFQVFATGTDAEGELVLEGGKLPHMKTN